MGGWFVRGDVTGSEKVAYVVSEGELAIRASGEVRLEEIRQAMSTDQCPAPLMEWARCARGGSCFCEYAQ